MEHVTALLQQEYAGITLFQIASSFIILFFTLTLRKVITNFLMYALERYAKKSKTEWDDKLIEVVKQPINVMILAYGLWLAIIVLPLPTDPVNIKSIVYMAGEIMVLVLIAWLLLRLVAVFDNLLKKKASDPEHWLDISITPMIGTSIRILVIIISAIVIAQNMGYSVSGLLASLGLGGAAVALASKDTLSNLFGSMMIVVDKPFKVGDWIKGTGFEGVVEEIGLRSTRIRTFGKTVENIPNNLLANVIVDNIDRRKDTSLKGVRRIKMTIGVTYSTTATQMQDTIEGIRTILKEDGGVDQSMTTLVYFTDFGGSSLDIFVYYFANSADWAYYLNVRQTVNLKIMRKLEELRVEIAFPSQSLYLESVPKMLTDGHGDVQKHDAI
jgi:MscS family membrane protein